MSQLQSAGSGSVHVLIEEEHTPRPLSWRKLMRFAGPGLLMCIAYVDPGNLESDLQAGAATGYTLLWLLGTTTLMGFLVQMQAARLGVATGRNLAELCKSHYPRPVSITLWIMAEVAIIGSDIQEVIGSALALSILSRGHLPMWASAVISACASFVLLLIERAGVRFLEGVFAAFIAVMIAAFGYLFTEAGVPLAKVAMGFLVPQLDRAALPTAVALFGSLIMPHNIYLHSALVQSRGLQGCSASVKLDALTYFGIESGLSLLAALVINTFVVCVFANGFHSTGTDIPDIGLRNAGEFLGAQYGPAMMIVWGLGLLAAGQSSTMTGTYTGQITMSSFLDIQVPPLARALITRSVALCPTLLVTLTMDPQSTSLDTLNQALNLLQSIQLPFALIPVLTFTGSVVFMGTLATRGPLLWASWCVALLVICINMTAVAQVTKDWAHEEMGSNHWLPPLVITLACMLYFGFLLYLIASAPEGCLPNFFNRKKQQKNQRRSPDQQPLLNGSETVSEPSWQQLEQRSSLREPLLVAGLNGDALPYMNGTAKSPAGVVSLNGSLNGGAQGLNGSLNGGPQGLVTVTSVGIGEEVGEWVVPSEASHQVPATARLLPAAAAAAAAAGSQQPGQIPDRRTTDGTLISAQHHGRRPDG